jgi:glucose dehydrogenase
MIFAPSLVRTAAVAAAVASLGAGPSPTATDDARFAAAAAQADDWLLPGATYSNAHYSALTQIDRTNVAGLVPRWTFHTGMRGGFETTPIVVGGVMYATIPGDDVVALDAASGTQLWRYHHTLRHKPCCGVANRGAAVAYGRVYVATADARLLALDSRTGAVVWDTRLDDETPSRVEHPGDLAGSDKLRDAPVIGQSGVFANMAPQIYRGHVIVGITGVGYGLHVGTNGKPDELTGGVVGEAGDYGTRGYYAAFDAATGVQLWRWHTIPDRGWEGAFRATTPDGSALPRDVAAERAAFAHANGGWKTGGGSAWTTPAIDPQLGLMYVGVGNPSPQFEDSTRPGDNLYSVALVALDVDTGKLRWAYQQVPHDLWGYDVASPPVLLDVRVDGRVVPAVMQAAKTGWLYVHDRRTGDLLRRSAPFVPQQNLYARPNASGVVIAPGAFGGASWSPVAYDARSELAYVAGIHLPMLYRTQSAPTAGGAALIYSEAVPDDASPRWGTLSAIDTQTGQIRWQQKTAQPLVGGVLTTAGGLTFTGEGGGAFDAFDAATGQQLWTYACGAGVNAPPISYRVGATQYIAVAAGGNALFGYPKGDTLFAFALPAAASSNAPPLNAPRANALSRSASR